MSGIRTSIHIEPTLTISGGINGMLILTHIGGFIQGVDVGYPEDNLIFS